MPVIEDVLYFHERLPAYQCRGCGDFIEIPTRAVLRAGESKQPVKGNPLNRIIWLELMAIDHEKCLQFNDERLANQARTFRKVVTARVDKSNGGSSKRLY